MTEAGAVNRGWAGASMPPIMGTLRPPWQVDQRPCTLPHLLWPLPQSAYCNPSIPSAQARRQPPKTNQQAKVRRMPLPQPAAALLPCSRVAGVGSSPARSLGAWRPPA